MTRRIVIEEPCEHDEVEPHVRRHAEQRADLVDLNGDPLPPEWIYTDLPCPGGSRTVITEPDYEAAADVLEMMALSPENSRDYRVQTARLAVDAALFGEKGGNE
jgi:hypothetical protein